MRVGVGTCLLCAALAFGLPVRAAYSQTETKRPMEPVDILDWKTIGSAELSPDGKWLAYRYSPVQGDSEVIVRATSGDTERRYAIGEIPPAQPPRPGGPPTPPPGAGPSGFAFSEDGKWFAYATYPKRAEAEKLRAQRKAI